MDTYVHGVRLAIYNAIFTRTRQREMNKSRSFAVMVSSERKESVAVVSDQKPASLFHFSNEGRCTVTANRAQHAHRVALVVRATVKRDKGLMAGFRLSCWSFHRKTAIVG